MPDLPFDVNFTLLIVSMFLIAAGILIYMPANIAPLPGEGVVEAVSLAYDKRFSKVKVCFDTSMVVLSLIICGLFTSDILGSVKCRYNSCSNIHRNYYKISHRIV